MQTRWDRFFVVRRPHTIHWLSSFMWYSYFMSKILPSMQLEFKYFWLPPKKLNQMGKECMCICPLIKNTITNTTADYHLWIKMLILSKEVFIWCSSLKYKKYTTKRGKGERSYRKSDHTFAKLIEQIHHHLTFC